MTYSGIPIFASEMAEGIKVGISPFYKIAQLNVFIN